MGSSTRACGFVIFRCLRGQIEYLLLQTSYGKHHWTPPKGHVDPGETDMITAYRETEEEAGLAKEDLKVYEDAKQELNYNVNDKPKIVVYWLAKLVNEEKGVTLSSEHQDFKWLDIREANKLVEHEDMRKALRYFESYVISKNIGAP